jgi:protein-tyrosine phosphatase
MAERLAIAYSARLNFEELTASSAGTRAVTGHPIEPYAARVLEELGGDASNFAARQLKPTIAASADLVLTMTRSHRDDVLKLAPQQLHRTFTLREAAHLASECSARNVSDLAAFRPRLHVGEESDIPDPIGHDGAYFAMTGATIANLLPPVLEICRHG